METVLVAARTVHFAAAISLLGVFAFERLVAVPPERMARRLLWLTWTSLVLALASGEVWLVAVAAEMSGSPFADVLSRGLWATVLTRTRFGADWLLRFGLSGLVALCLVLPRRSRTLSWVKLFLAALFLASLAWAGHGAATPGVAGDLHVAADVLHLLAGGAWLGMLVPFALLLAEARRAKSGDWAATARIATRRFSVIAIASVAVLLATGVVNTWFLAGTMPAMFGTGYGRLLLVKITLFALLLTIGAVNLRRLAPRLVGAGETVWPALAWLRRNALSEATIGLGVIAIVGALGGMIPGLHSEPRWPFSFRIEPAELTFADEIVLALLATAAGAAVAAAVAEAAAERYRRTAAWVVGFALCLAAGWLPLQGAIERAYPTSFAVPAEPYAALSIVRGAALYAENCALCHGAGGAGDGPAAAGLRVRPADLTQPHLFSHTPGDLFWQVTRGSDDGAMPGFAEAMTASQCWDVINFVRARAAGILSRRIGTEITAEAAPSVPDFAFSLSGGQQTLGELLKTGPVLLILFAPPAPIARLAALAETQPSLGLSVIAVPIAQSERQPFIADASIDVRSALALFRTPDDGGETELLLDHSGAVRARWTTGEPGGLADTATLAIDAARVGRLQVAAPIHTSHSH